MSLFIWKLILEFRIFKTYLEKFELEMAFFNFISVMYFKVSIYNTNKKFIAIMFKFIYTYQNYRKKKMFS